MRSTKSEKKGKLVFMIIFKLKIMVHYFITHKILAFDKWGLAFDVDCTSTSYRHFAGKWSETIHCIQTSHWPGWWRDVLQCNKPVQKQEKGPFSPNPRGGLLQEVFKTPVTASKKHKVLPFVLLQPFWCWWTRVPAAAAERPARPGTPPPCRCTVQTTFMRRYNDEGERGKDNQSMYSMF